MKVAFLLARQSERYSALMIESVKRHMPHAELIHLTDEDTPGVAGCKVIRKKWDGQDPLIFRMKHLRELYGEALVLDTDVIVQRDISSVLALPFDVALTWRDGPVRDPNGVDLARIMPYNTGVVFHRSPLFWEECLKWCVGKDLGWYADQFAVAAIAPKFNVLRLHCDNFNYTPKSADEDVSMRFAVHYKGKRRAYMDQRFGLTLEAEAT